MASESAFTPIASRVVLCCPPPMVASASASLSATSRAWRYSAWPASVGVQGVARRTSTWPTRSSSSLMRCDTAERVTCSTAAARSKLPSSITVANALSWAESSCMDG